MVKEVIARGATDIELQFFAEVCKRTGLDPFMKQIYMIKRPGGEDGEKQITIQAAIDGLRIIAERSGKYEGQLGPFWCGPDGQWLEAWLDFEYPPNACRIGILHKGFSQPLWATAHFHEYVQRKSGGQPTRIWQKMPANQLAKCAEALGLRKAFPMELSGIYTTDEMAQSDVSNETEEKNYGHPPPPPPPVQPKAPIPPSQNYAPEVPEALQEMYGELANGMGETIAIFGKFKALLGDLTGSDHYYYEILERGEMKHGNDLKGKTRGSVKKVLAELYYAVEKLRAEPVLPPSDENGNADDMPEEL